VRLRLVYFNQASGPTPTLPYHTLPPASLLYLRLIFPPEPFRPGRLIKKKGKQERDGRQEGGREGGREKTRAHDPDGKS